MGIQPATTTSPNRFGEKYNRGVFGKTSKTHVAFLTPFPNSVGCSVLIPRIDLSSDDDYEYLIRATQTVKNFNPTNFQKNSTMKSAQVVWAASVMMLESFMRDYTHVKFYPMASRNAKTMESTENVTGDSDNQQ